MIIQYWKMLRSVEYQCFPEIFANDQMCWIWVRAVDRVFLNLNIYSIPFWLHWNANIKISAHANMNFKFVYKAISLVTCLFRRVGGTWNLNRFSEKRYLGGIWRYLRSFASFGSESQKRYFSLKGACCCVSGYGGIW